MSVRLDDLDYFLAVADAGQVRRAAAQLGVSQPAVTKGIQRLERDLGFELFERGAKGMTLTAVAQHFHQRTRSLRGNLTDAIKEATDLHLGSVGILRAGVSPLYVEQLFAPACLQLHRQRPAARVRVMLNLNDALMSALRQGDLDLAISALPGLMPDELRAEPLFDDNLCIVARTGHPLFNRRRLRLSDLAAADWILPGPAVAARRSLEGRLAEAGLPAPKVAIEVSSSASHLSSMLLHSDLLSLMGESMLASDAGQGLQALPMSDARFSRVIGVLTRKDIEPPPLARRLVEILREHGARLRPASAAVRRG